MKNTWFGVYVVQNQFQKHLLRINQGRRFGGERNNNYAWNSNIDVAAALIKAFWFSPSNLWYDDEFGSRLDRTEKHIAVVWLIFISTHKEGSGCICADAVSHTLQNSFFVHRLSDVTSSCRYGGRCGRDSEWGQLSADTRPRCKTRKVRFLLEALSANYEAPRTAADLPLIGGK